MVQQGPLGLQHPDWPGQDRVSAETAKEGYQSAYVGAQGDGGERSWGTPALVSSASPGIPKAGSPAEDEEQVEVWEVRGQRRRQDRHGGVDELGKHSVTARCPATPLDVSRPKSKLNRRGRVDRRRVIGGTDQAQPCWNKRWQIFKSWAELVENKGGGGKSPPGVGDRPV